MDENKPARRSHLRYGIRDLLWAMVVVGLAVGWWQSHRQIQTWKGNAESVAGPNAFDNNGRPRRKGTPLSIGDPQPKPSPSR